jgi:N-acetylglucosaminyldiphosphoundecaprenol N-acetyl-beta-D-mannosaminyltransferase
LTPRERLLAAYRGGKPDRVPVDFIAGTKRQAPVWMRKSGLEWLFRLSQEPGRLWWRYLYHNPRFMVLVMLPLLFKQAS